MTPKEAAAEVKAALEEAMQKHAASSLPPITIELTVPPKKEDG